MECMVCGLEDEEEDAEDMREEVAQHGQAEVKILKGPYKPSKQEVEEHRPFHLPFRSWCRHCVFGRGKNAACFRLDEGEGSMPEISIDFQFPRHEDGECALTTLVAKERRSRVRLASC